MGCVQSGSYLAELNEEDVTLRKVSKNSKGAIRSRTRPLPVKGRARKWALEPRFARRSAAPVFPDAATPQPNRHEDEADFPAPLAVPPEAEEAVQLDASPYAENRPTSPHPEGNGRAPQEGPRIVSALTPAPPPLGKVKGKEPMLNTTKLGTVRSWIDATDQEELVDPNDPVGHEAMMKIRRVHRGVDDEGVFDDF